MDRFQRVVFTGPPGAGKTTTAEDICKTAKDIALVNEAATRLLKQHESDGKSRDEAEDLMRQEVKPLQRQDMSTRCEGDEIFDRSLICSLVYDHHYGAAPLPDPSSIGNCMRNTHSFSQHVFLFELGQDREYTQKDTEGRTVRCQSYLEATELLGKFRHGYERAGFTVHSIPWMERGRRAKMVHSFLEELRAAAAQNASPNFSLYRRFAAMNDEGGRIRECVSAGQLWTNLSVVLDRPYVDWIDYAEIKQKKIEQGYTFKEAAIGEFNERQVGLAYLMLMRYYITRGHDLVGKKPTEPLLIILHAFRQADGDGVLRHLEHLLEVGWPKLVKKACGGSTDLKTEVFRRRLPQHNATLIFSRWKADKDPHKSAYGHFRRSKTFGQADLILTFSVHVGLHPEWGPGTLVVPNEWTPIDVETMVVKRSETYRGGNHLISTIGDIADMSRVQSSVLQHLRRDYQSQNQEKREHAIEPLQASHFRTGMPFIELGGYIFTPSNAPRKCFQFDQ